MRARATAARATAMRAERREARHEQNRIHRHRRSLVALALLSSTLFVVDQRQFGVVYALGQIKEVITEPGLNFKLPPPFQNVSYIDKRLLTLDSLDTEPMLTAEKQRVVIDWYVRWRITNPSEYIRNVGLDENAGANQLNRVVRNAFQEEHQQAHRARPDLGAPRGADGRRAARGAGRGQGRQALGRGRRRRAHHARRLRRGDHRVGLPPHGGRAQARGQRAAFHRLRPRARRSAPMPTASAR